MSSERVLVDTNLFLRYLTNDVPDQADAVERLFQRAAAGQLALVINTLIIAEIVWTLESFYQLTRASIRDKLQSILNTPGLEVADQPLVLQALIWYAELNVDFIDAYNAAWARQQSLAAVYTFDRKHFARIPGLDFLIPGQPTA